MSLPPEQTGPLRAKEQQAACETVGVHDLTILDHPDGTLVYSLDLRRDIARQIRQFRPDAVVLTNFEVEAYGGLNQADHRAAGLAGVDAVRDADNAWVFPELADQGLQPWHTRWILVAGRGDSNSMVPVDQDAVDAAVASLGKHQAYLADLPGHWDPAEVIPTILRAGAQGSESHYAVDFRSFDQGEGLRPREQQD